MVPQVQKKTVLIVGSILVVLIAAILLTVAWSGGGNSPFGGASATQVLQESLAAANESGSVNFVDRTDVSASQQQQIQGAISAASAAEIASGGNRTFEVELIAGAVYVNGPAPVLQSALQITSAQASPVAGKWIEVSPSDAPFQNLTQSLTLDASLGTFTPSGKLKFGNVEKVGGKSVVAITGSLSAPYAGSTGTTSLLVSTSRPYLPVAGSVDARQGKSTLTEVAAYKNWGARVVLTPPGSYISFSSVLAGCIRRLPAGRHRWYCLIEVSFGAALRAGTSECAGMSE